MAEHLDDGEFWLPPQFLTDDDVLMDFKANKASLKSRETDSGGYFPYDFPCGFGSFGPYSDLSSPGESVVSSTETESDEEDYIAGLTRKLAQSTLKEDFLKTDSGLGYENQKTYSMAGSPQSILCSAMGGFGCKEDSSRGSPNCPSLVSSPPQPAALSRSDAAWDLLYAAAGEVARMRNRMANEGVGFYQKGSFYGPPRKPSPVSVPPKNPNPNPGFQSNKSLSYQQLQVAQFQQLKQQQMMKQQGPVLWGQSEGGGRCSQNPQNHANQVFDNRPRSNGRPLGLSPSAWPTLQQSQQQQPGSGMRALFLGNSSAKRECAGTGVFLPRRVGTPTETRKKPGCSTVLLPDRVVQALNLNMEAMEAQTQLQSRPTMAFTPEYDAALKHRNNVLMAAQQKLNVRPRLAVNQELRLPTEWTY
ncbi:Sushi, nidogen and EGF-like domain-containing protein [Actinidia chinensis var. chinensis]|uniref:Sushi, nidogen and EGF-like domain-containing protein n=1 Tax=Actinidia chinensis var. chinensis TaxID=1590841 RepID=A0A2R6RX65_ACTCC|nr:Sushi, nidogen and EGF-like domain-containing protein [Actinidia chinensis var. chinensis]